MYEMYSDPILYWREVDELRDDFRAGNHDESTQYMRYIDLLALARALRDYLQEVESLLKAGKFDNVSPQ